MLRSSEILSFVLRPPRLCWANDGGVGDKGSAEKDVLPVFSLL